MRGAGDTAQGPASQELSFLDTEGKWVFYEH